MSSRRIIAVTGTPGVGKSSFAREISDNLEYELIDLNKLIDEKKIYELDVDGTRVVETEDLRIEFEKVKEEQNDDLIVDGLLSHLLRPDQITDIVVLRTDPKILEKRLKSRDFSMEKIKENIEAEALGVILSEAIEIHGTNKICEIDSTERSVEDCVKLFEKAIKGELELSPGKIDWLEEFY